MCTLGNSLLQTKEIPVYLGKFPSTHLRKSSLSSKEKLSFPTAVQFLISFVSGLEFTFNLVNLILSVLVSTRYLSYFPKYSDINMLFFLFFFLFLPSYNR